MYFVAESIDIYEALWGYEAVEMSSPIVPLEEQPLSTPPSGLTWCGELEGIVTALNL